jgi:hypothetical protein
MAGGQAPTWGGLVAGVHRLRPGGHYVRSDLNEFHKRPAQHYRSSRSISYFYVALPDGCAIDKLTALIFV